MANLPFHREEVYPFTVINLLNANFYESEQGYAKYRGYITKTNHLPSTFYYAIKNTFSYKVDDYQSVETFTLTREDTANPYTLEYEGESFTCQNLNCTINKTSVVSKV